MEIFHFLIFLAITKGVERSGTFLLQSFSKISEQFLANIDETVIFNCIDIIYKRLFSRFGIFSFR